MRTSERGFTYLLLLFVLVAGGVLIGAAVPSWQAAAERERETELAFRGNEIRSALLRYRRATPDGQPPRPRSLEQLLTDERALEPRHWLRRLYADPMTGHPDWRLLRDAEGGITGVASRSGRVLRTASLPGAVPAAAARAPFAARDWLFTTEEDPRETP